MMQILLIGIGAGAAAALLRVSVASGSLLALLLAYLAPLPILIAGIGWSYLAAVVAAMFAALCLVLAGFNQVALSFLVGMGIPSCWLAYLALLARPAGDGSPEAVEWYPAGRIVFWATIAGALAVVIWIPFFGTDAESFHANLRAFFEAQFGLRDRPGGELNPDAMRVDMDLVVKLVPTLATVGATFALLINTWLAARVVKVSNRLRRPWPDLSAMTFPKSAPVLLAVALAGIFLPGLISVAAEVFATALMMGFAILGFAVLHVATRNMSGRAVLLGVVYPTVILLIWPAIIMALIGLADTALDLRGRIARTRSPPTLH